MSWNLSKLGDNCTITSSRRFHLDERKKEGVPFYSSKEVIQLCNGESITDCQYISDEAYEDVKCRFGVPKENDLLLTTRGTYGIPYLYRSSDKFYFSDGNLTWFKDFGESLDSKFLYYWFKSSEGWGKVDSIAKGTAQKAVPIDALKDLEIPLPQLPIQRRIADILSAYDDLIENNQRQIKLLEEAAMRLYREWFVFMRFPGHESVRIEDGVPEGWEKKKVSSIMKFVKGKNLGDVSFEKLDGYEKLLLLDGLESDVTTYACAEKQVLAKDGDILMLMDGARSSHTFITDAGIVGSTLSLIEITENQIPVSYVKGYFDANLNLFVNNNTGSAIPHANRKFIEGSDILIPNLQLLENYDNISGVFLKRVRSLNHMNQQLRISRDALLPRLMNGGEGLKLEGGAV